MRRCLLAFALILTASISFGGTYRVTTTGDDGPGSFREGILAANSGACASPCTITFERSGEEAFVIEPLSPLPAITASTLTIAGDPTGSGLPPPVEIRGSRVESGHGLHFLGVNGYRLKSVMIHGFPGHGVFIERAYGLTLESNQIGSAELPNGLEGIAILASNSIEIHSQWLHGPSAGVQPH